MNPEDKRSVMLSIKVTPVLARTLEGLAVALNRPISGIGEEALLLWIEGVKRGMSAG